MENKVVRLVPVKEEVVNLNNIKKLRVAAYARVSTDKDEQVSSYNSQVDYYTNYITKNPEWEFAGLYSDEGISGVMTKGRNGFIKMVSDAKNGKMDIIITKSISRFARNTVDTLKTVRELKNRNVEVIFEKENIRTFDTKGELMLSILSSLAQDESRSISENVQWGIRKRFKEGHARVRTYNCIGFIKDENGKLIIKPEDALTVKKIYKWFINGHSYADICTFLKNGNIKTPAGLKTWCKSSVKAILTNEKYCGDALCQKVYTVDYMTRKVIKNDGKVPQYYIENNHDPIISKDIFNIAQDEIKKRAGTKATGDIISNKLICGYCGAKLGRTYRYNINKEPIFSYRCRHKDDYKCFCRIIYLEDIEKMFIKGVKHLLYNKDSIIKNAENELNNLDIDNLKGRLDNQENRLKILVNKINNYVYKSAKINDISETEKAEYDDNKLEYIKASRTVKRLNKEYEDMMLKRSELTMFLNIIKDFKGSNEFSLDAWGNLLNRFIVYNDKIVLKFYGNFEYVITNNTLRGYEIPAPTTYQINRLKERIIKSVNVDGVEGVDNNSVNKNVDDLSVNKNVDDIAEPVN